MEYSSTSSKLSSPPSGGVCAPKRISETESSKAVLTVPERRRPNGEAEMVNIVVADAVVGVVCLSPLSFEILIIDLALGGFNEARGGGAPPPVAA